MDFKNGSQTATNSTYLPRAIWYFAIYPALFMVLVVLFHQVLSREYTLINLRDIFELLPLRGWRNLIGASLLASITVTCFHFIRFGGKVKIYAVIIFSLLVLMIGLYQIGLVMFESFAEFKPIPLLYIDGLKDYPDEIWKIIACELVAFSPLGILIAHWVIRYDSRNHPFGNAHFATPLEVVRGGFLNKNDESIIIGKKYGQPLMSNGFEHVLCVAASGSGKTSAISIPNLFSFPYSVVANDVKLSLYKITSGYREKVLGNQCFVWAPADEGGKTHCYNPFTLISTDKVQRMTDIQRIAHVLIPESKGDNAIWAKLSRGLFKALVLYLLDTPESKVTLGEMNRLIKKASFNQWLHEKLMDTTHYDDEFYRNGFAYIKTNERTRDSIHIDLISRFELFDDPRIDAATSKSDFDLRNLRKEKMTIYVGFSDNDMERLSPILTIFWQQVIACMIQRIPDVNEEPYPLLCLIDEFSSLGRLEQFRRSLKLLREYRVRCILMVQYIAQTLEKYNQYEAKAFTNIKTKLAFTTDDYQDAEFISKLMGTKTQRINTGSHSMQERGSSRTKSYSFQSVPLQKPEEIMKMKPSTTLIMRTGQQPVRAKQYAWYKDRVMKHIDYQPVSTPTQMVTFAAFDHQEKLALAEEKNTQPTYRPTSDALLD